jgi:ABC-type dipeptide/oligopeptide/nickel transport system permease component
MTRAILARLFASAGVVLGAVTLIFLILHWLPGDVATLIAGESASEEIVARLRSQLGTERPLLERYGEYLSSLAQGDLGNSFVTKEPVLERLLAQFPATLSLAAWAALLATVLGVGLGVLSARMRGRWLDQALQASTLWLGSVPPFWLGILAILVFSVGLGWLPVIGDGGALAMVMPVGCLGVLVAMHLMRIVRDGMLETLQEPFVTTLRAKGLAARRIFYVHVLRNVLIVALTYISVLFGELLSGAVVMDTLFARQGIGRLAVEAIGQKDVPVVQGAILLASLCYVSINLVVDICYALIDPRVRLARGTR